MSGNFPQSKGSDSANEQARAARAAETGAAIRTLEQ